MKPLRRGEENLAPDQVAERARTARAKVLTERVRGKRPSMMSAPEQADFNELVALKLGIPIEPEDS